MAEGARLESVYTATYREFESLRHRHIKKPAYAGFLRLGVMRTREFDNLVGNQVERVSDPQGKIHGGIL